MMWLIRMCVIKVRSRRVGFAPRADIRPVPAFTSTNASKTRAARLRESPPQIARFFGGGGRHAHPRISSHRVPTPCRACPVGQGRRAEKLADNQSGGSGALSGLDL